jgi:hypothetical protein
LTMKWLVCFWLWLKLMIKQCEYKFLVQEHDAACTMIFFSVSLMFKRKKSQKLAQMPWILLKCCGVQAQDLVGPPPIMYSVLSILYHILIGIGPSTCMSIAERLYTQGYISYPRTETTHYPENFDLKWDRS